LIHVPFSARVEERELFPRCDVFQDKNMPLFLARRRDIESRVRFARVIDVEEVRVEFNVVVRPVTTLDR